MIWCGEGSCFTKTGWLPEGFPNDSATYSKSFHFNLAVFDDLFPGAASDALHSHSAARKKTYKQDASGMMLESRPPNIWMCKHLLSICQWFRPGSRPKSSVSLHPRIRSD